MAKYAKEDTQRVRELAEADLYTFAVLVNPHRLYGDIHRELFNWWTRPEALDNQLTLLPRDHQKSHCIAVRVAWELTKDPSLAFLYISATANLAEKQLLAIKNILTSDVYRRYWPEMVEKEEAKRKLWNVSEVSVDHPAREREGVRDSSITAAGLTTNITGLHPNRVVLDDVVAPKNAYTEEGRESVMSMFSQLSSVETTGAKEWAVGTRYHPADLYGELKDMVEEDYDMDGNVLGTRPVYETFEKQVESDGVFLWPKLTREDGKSFGFDAKELARKRAKYLDKAQFWAQYYNDPNDPSSHRIDSSKFQYYELKHLEHEGGQWFYKGKRLFVYAAADLAFSMNKTSDYTAIVVIGIDCDGYIYILGMSRFKTNKYEDYYREIIDLHHKWSFRKLLIETNAGGSLVCEYVKDRVRQEGNSLSIDGQASLKNEGSKQERISAILEPRYENQTIWHHRSGLNNMLEEEVILKRPKHDDLKDALAAAISIAKPPGHKVNKMLDNKVIQFHPRFGGRVR